MRLDDVRAALAVRAASVAPPATPAPDVLATLRRRAHRKRVRRMVAAAAVVTVAIAGSTAGVLALRTGGRDHVLVTGREAPGTTVPRGITAQQLRAHTGSGAPAGWVPVDAGDARLFVPPDWFVARPGWCLGGAFPGGVGVEKMPDDGCQPGQSATPPNEAAIVTSSAAVSGAPVAAVHGYVLYRATAAPTPGWTVYDVPALHTRISLRGPLQAQVLATLAPSARKVALAAARSRSPAGQRVTTDGLALTIPASWAVETPTAVPCALVGDWSPRPPRLVRILPGAQIPPCPPGQPTAANAAGDNLLLYTAGALAPQAQGTPLAVLRHGRTTVRVFDDQNGPNALELSVQRDGSREVHVLELALGPDGRVAGGILASIVAMS